MDIALDFSVELHQNKFLSTVARNMHAVITVTARDRSGAAEPVAPPPAPELAEVIVIDCSSSMNNPQTKIIEARRATLAAIDALPEGVRFAVVQGTLDAANVYPAEPGLVVATAQTRLQAKAAAAGLPAAGGTAIGTWLTHASELLATRPAAIGHTLLLTDGRNEHEDRDQLEMVLANCRGRFVCDARGIGDGWEPRELTRIAEVLHGTADAVRRPDELTADFRETMRAAMAKAVPEVRIRIQTLPWARVAFFKQAAPSIVDLAEHRITVDGRTVEYSTGSWGNESREYHLGVEMDVAQPPMFRDIGVAWIEVLTAGQLRAGPAAVLAHWTDDPVPPTRIHPAVAHHTNQGELSRVVLAGCDAYNDGDTTAAEAHLGKAVRIAAGSGNEAALENLRRLVEIIDADQGRVRLREDRPDIDWKITGVRGTHSASYPGRPRDNPAGTPAPPAGADRKCGECGRVNRASARFCEQCRTELGTAGSDGPNGRAEE